MTTDPKKAFSAELGIRLEVSRVVLGLSVDDMREVLGGITRSAYSEYKAGRKMPEPYRLAPLLDRGFTSDYLLFGRIALLPSAILSDVQRIEPEIRQKMQERLAASEQV